jgi:hypothetical protein
MSESTKLNVDANALCYHQRELAAGVSVSCFKTAEWNLGYQSWNVQDRRKEGIAGLHVTSEDRKEQAS